MTPNNPMTEGEALAVLRELRDTGDVSDWQAMESALTMAIDRLTAHTAASGGEVVAWAVRWQQGPIKRATQVFTDAETARGFYEWRKGSPCSEPVEFLQLVTAPPAAVPADALVQEGGGEVTPYGVARASSSGVAALLARNGVLESANRNMRFMAAPPSAPVEAKARAMFEAQADKLAAPWDRQWEPTKRYWREQAALRQQPEARGVVDFEAWLDRDWPLWRNNPDNPIIARLRRAWDAALTAAQQPGQEGGGEAEFALRALVAAGHVLQRHVDQARAIARDLGTAPPSAPVGVDGLAGLLEQIRDLLASLPVDCLGTDTAADGQPYPIRDEVIHSITKALAQQPAQAAPGHLTADEREWLDYAIEHMRDDSEPEDLTCADVLEALLQRATPPGDDAAGGGL